MSGATTPLPSGVSTPDLRTRDLKQPVDVAEVCFPPASISPLQLANHHSHSTSSAVCNRSVSSPSTVFPVTTTWLPSTTCPSAVSTGLATSTSSTLVCAPPSSPGPPEETPPLTLHLSRLRFRRLRQNQGYLCHCHHLRCRRALCHQRHCWRLLGIRSHRPHCRLPHHFGPEERPPAPPHPGQWRLQHLCRHEPQGFLRHVHAERPP